jgi:hypothetical protein
MGLVELGGFVDRSVRRRGQLLVVAGALVGALAGGLLGVADDARLRAGASVQQARAARAAPGPAGGQASGSEGDGPSSQVAAGPAGRRGGGLGRDDRGDKAAKDRKHAREPKGGHRKAEPGKANDKGKRG